MRRWLAGATAVLIAGLPAAAWGTEEATVFELIESGAEMQGQEVVVTGELVGDYGFRNDGWMWTQLNGDAYVAAPIREGGPAAGGNTGIGIRMPHAMGEGLDPPGGYRQRGPVVRVTGAWRYHDPQRQGESYLEAQTLVVIERGRPLHQRPNAITIALGAVLVAAAAALWFSRSEP